MCLRCLLLNTMRVPIGDRYSALEVLFDTLKFHGAAFTTQFWMRIFDSILLPIFDHVRAEVGPPTCAHATTPHHCSSLVITGWSGQLVARPSCTSVGSSVRRTCTRGAQAPGDAPRIAPGILPPGGRNPRSVQLFVPSERLEKCGCDPGQDCAGAGPLGVMGTQLVLFGMARQETWGAALVGR
jgi:hypothetical protein